MEKVLKTVLFNNEMLKYFDGNAVSQLRKTQFCWL